VAGGLFGDDLGRVADGDSGVLEGVGTVRRKRRRSGGMGLRRESKRKDLLFVCACVDDRE